MLAICRVAVLNNAENEFVHYLLEFKRVGGTAARIEVLRKLDASADEAALFHDSERVMIRLVIEDSVRSTV